MKYYLLYLSACFLLAYLLRDRNRKWRYFVLTILSLILCVSYLFFGKL